MLCLAELVELLRLILLVLVLLPLLLASSAVRLRCRLVLGVDPEGSESGIVAGFLLVDIGVCCCALLLLSISFVIRELIVPVVPTLIEPPAPLISSGFETMTLL